MVEPCTFLEEGKTEADDALSPEVEEATRRIPTICFNKKKYKHGVRGWKKR